MKNKTKLVNGSNSCVKQDLLKTGSITEENLFLYSDGTRDNQNIKVFKDKFSEVIFIDSFYIGENSYKTGSYRDNNEEEILNSKSSEFEDYKDSLRRFEDFSQFIISKKIADFGCGKGNFLRKCSTLTEEVYGVELQKNFREELQKDGIKCFENLQSLQSGNLDLITLFHSFEHLDEPLKILNALHSKLKPKGEGKIIIEVPHARDLLLNQLSNVEFKEFTLWSQHLILHTRESLRRFLIDAGFKNILIKGVQRYGLSNHIKWLSNNKPGGHKDIISFLESKNLLNSYEDALRSIDSTDTIIAIAESK